MVAEKLAVASSEPVSLDDTTEKNIPEIKPDADAAAPVDKATKSAKDDDLQKETKGSEDAKDPAVKKSTGIEAQTGQGSIPDDNSEDAPPRPQRPLSPIAQIKKELREAFPQIEDKYIQACLIASGGRADPAFSALLYLLDPSYEPEIEQAPPLPSQRPVAALTDDELLARQLQKEFDKEERKRRARASQRSNRGPDPAGEESPDEFEQLKESFTQGFEEAKLTLNSWVSGISKNFSGEDKPAGGSSGGAQNPKLFGALGGSSFNKNTQRATNFDDDPEILSLNFQRNLDMRDLAPAATGKPQPVKKDTKWQPLNSDVPMSSDAFLVTDSEDEDKDVKKPWL